MSADQRQWSVRVPVVKADGPRGLVTGWVSVVSTADGTPIVDADGDVIPAHELEKAVQDAMMQRGSGHGAVGDMHAPMLRGSGDLVETFVFTREKYKALGLQPGPEGWVVTFKVDPTSQLFADIQSGRKAELSLKGTAGDVQEIEIDAAA